MRRVCRRAPCARSRASNSPRHSSFITTLHSPLFVCLGVFIYRFQCLTYTFSSVKTTDSRTDHVSVFFEPLHSPVSPPPYTYILLCSPLLTHLFTHTHSHTHTHTSTGRCISALPRLQERPSRRGRRTSRRRRSYRPPHRRRMDPATRCRI